MAVAISRATDELVVQAKARAAELLEAAIGDVVLDLERGSFHVAGAPGAASVDSSSSDAVPSICSSASSRS